MTGAEFSGVDIDLLADYVGGALDGTPDETVVTALIADDPAWRDAYARLSGGVAVVTGQLQTLGSAAEPMPADVFARLDAALLAAATDQESDGELVSIGDVRAAGAGRGRAAGEATAIDADSSGATAAPAAMEPGSDGAAVDRHLVAVPSGSRGRGARHLRWAAPVGIAAGVLAFGFMIQQQLPGDGGSSDTAAHSVAEQPASAPRAAAGQELSLPTGSVPIKETGTDYRRATLGQANRALVAPDPQQQQDSDQLKTGPSAGPGSARTGDPFSQLRVQEVLQACIQAIAAQHGVGEITPQAVDFARFNGAPAVIVEFTAANGSWVWAAGPACGTPGVGAATLASVQVG